MLEQIVKVVNDYQGMYNGEKAKLKTEMEHIDKVYNPMSSEYYNSKDAIRKAFNEKIESERLVANENIRKYAEQDRQTLAEITSTPVPADALTTIEVLKIGNADKISEFEVKSILEKYKDNYLATKMILDVTNADKRFGMVFSSADNIVQDISKIEDMACDFIRAYNGNATYPQAVLLNGKIIMDVNEAVQEFVKYNYVSQMSDVMRKAMNA